MFDEDLGSSAQFVKMHFSVLVSLDTLNSALVRYFFYQVRLDVVFKFFAFLKTHLTNFSLRFIIA